ncbi:MAG: hypothetical protein ABSB35_37655 [Bryobacteraceae bacterium]|jgi:hypothetical protein
MGTNFWFAVVLVYAGFTMTVAEVALDPFFLRRSERIQLLAFAAVFCLIAWFTIRIPLMNAPLAVDSWIYPGQHSDVTIGTIKWNSHFTDLRVTLTNPSPNDYDDLNITLVPKAWIYDATLLDSNGCTLNRSAGGDVQLVSLDSKVSKHHSFSMRKLPDGSMEVYDSEGNLYHTVATNSGFTLRCSKVASTSTIHLVFAAVSQSNDLPEPVATTHISDLSVGAFKDFTDEFKLFGDKPSVKAIEMRGYYRREKKTFSATLHVPVQER